MRKNKMSQLVRFASLAIAGNTAIAQAALEESRPTGGTIEEIVVSAQRREQLLQDVPIAISAFSGQQLERSQIDSPADLTFVTPGLNFGRTLGFASPFLRGVGTTNITAGDEPSVATYIDGVYQGSMLAAALPFNDIERIEVLKGPQGTLFGRNATGGLVNIVTKRPASSPEFKASVAYERFDAVETELYASGPITDNVQASIAGRKREQGEGYVSNHTTGNDIGEENSESVRLKVAIQPTDSLDIDLAADYTEADSTVGSARVVAPGTVPLAALGGGQYSTKAGDTYLNIDPIFQTRTWGANAQITSQLDWVNFVSRTAYRETDNLNVVEADGSSLDNVPAVVHPTLGVRPLPSLAFSSSQSDPYFVTQEFQLQSEEETPVSWTVGVFGQKSRADYEPLRLFPGSTSPAFASITSQVKTSAYAIFGQTEIAVTDKASVTAGLRYNYEEKEFEGTGTGAFAALHPSSDTDWEALTWRLAGEYKITDDIMIYGVASRGFKSGTYNSNSLTDPGPVDPEQLDALELGIKADPMRWLRINASVYSYEYKDLQLLQLVSAGTSKLANAARAKIEGFEAEIEAIPIENLSLRAGMSAIDSEYSDYDDAAVYVPAPPAGNATVSLDASGNQLVRTPDLTYNLGVSYEVEWASVGTFIMSADWYHSSGFPWEAAGRVEQPEYDVVNASVAWRTVNDRFGVTIYARNLTDETYGIYGTSSDRVDAIAYAPPRVAGVRVDVKWD